MNNQIYVLTDLEGNRYKATSYEQASQLSTSKGWSFKGGTKEEWKAQGIDVESLPSPKLLLQ